MVFHEGIIPPQTAKPVMMLDLGGNALCIKWKACDSLYSDEQATSQGIPKDSACYMGYADTMDCMHQAGVTAINGYQRGAPQVIHPNRECTGNPKTHCWSILTDNMVNWMGRDHVHFISMYVTTLKVAKDHHTLVSGPKFTGIAQFRNVATNRRGSREGGTGGGCGGGKGGWCPPPPKVDDDLSSDDSDDE